MQSEYGLCMDLHVCVLNAHCRTSHHHQFTHTSRNNICNDHFMRQFERSTNRKKIFIFAVSYNIIAGEKK